MGHITYEEFKIAMAEKERIERYLQHLTTITRAYIYQEEAERVKNRKADSAKHYREQENQESR